MKKLIALIIAAFFVAMPVLANTPLVPFPQPLRASASGGGGGGGGTVTGTGANHEVAFWTGASAISGSSNFGYQDPASAILSVTPEVSTIHDVASQVIPLGGMNATVGGSEEIVLGQAHDATDGNYSVFFNNNSGFVTDGLFEQGTTALGSGSNLTGAKILLYTQNAEPIIFATGGHATANERGRFTNTGFNMPRGILSVNIDARTQPQPGPFYVSSASNDYTSVLANNLATNGALQVFVNDVGDTFQMGLTGSTGFAILGATQAKVAILVDNSPGGMAIGTFQAKPIMFATANAERTTLEGDGGWAFKEQSAAAVVAGHDVIYGDSTAHAMMLSNGADASSPIARRDAGFSTGDVSSTDATTPVDVLSVVLAVGSYTCAGNIVLHESTAADGAQAQFFATGVTSTTGVFTSQIFIDDGGAGVAVPITKVTSGATSGAVAASSLSDGAAVFDATLVVTVGGTVKLRVLQNTHSTGTLTAKKGASLFCSRL